MVHRLDQTGVLLALRKPFGRVPSPSRSDGFFRGIMDVIPTATRKLLNVLRERGHDVETATVTDDPSGVEHHRVVAVDRRTGERWAVTAPDAYSAACELALALGWELE